MKVTKHLTVRVLVDVTNDFVVGVFGSAAAVAKMPAMLEFITLSEDAEELVVATWEDHGADYEASHENLKFPVAHGVRGTQGSKLHGSVGEYMDGKAAARDKRFIAISKDRFMAFGCDTVLRRIIAAYHPGENHDEGHGVTFIIAGLVTNICVIANAIYLQAAFPWAKIIVDAGACAGVTPQLHEAALDVMASMAMEVINRQEK